MKETIVVGNVTGLRELFDKVRIALRDTGEVVEITVRKYRDTRSSAQNRRMWSMLNDVAQQVEWGGEKLDAEDWKDLITAALNREQKLVRGLNGGLVALGSRTSRMTIAEMTEVMDYLSAWGAQQEPQVRFKVEDTGLLRSAA